MSVAFFWCWVLCKHLNQFYSNHGHGDVTGMTVYAGGEKYHVSIDYY